MSMRMPGGLRAVILLLTVLVLSVSGCGSEENGSEEKKREYSIPDSVCGMNFNSGLISPFLPPGKRINDAVELDETNWHCEVSVDGTNVFMLTWEWWEPGWSTERFAVRQAYADPDRKSADGNYVYSDEDAVAVVRCTKTGGKWDIFLTARARNGGIPDAEAMERFIVAYRDDFLKSDPCADQ